MTDIVEKKRRLGLSTVDEPPFSDTSFQQMMSQLEKENNDFSDKFAGDKPIYIRPVKDPDVEYITNQFIRGRPEIPFGGMPEIVYGRDVPLEDPIPDIAENISIFGQMLGQNLAELTTQEVRGWLRWFTGGARKIIELNNALQLKRNYSIAKTYFSALSKNVKFTDEQVEVLSQAGAKKMTQTGNKILSKTDKICNEFARNFGGVFGGSVAFSFALVGAANDSIKQKSLLPLANLGEEFKDWIISLPKGAIQAFKEKGFWGGAEFLLVHSPEIVAAGKLTKGTVRSVFRNAGKIADWKSPFKQYVERIVLDTDARGYFAESAKDAILQTVKNIEAWQEQNRQIQTKLKDISKEPAPPDLTERTKKQTQLYNLSLDLQKKIVDASNAVRGMLDNYKGIQPFLNALKAKTKLDPERTITWAAEAGKGEYPIVISEAFQARMKSELTRYMKDYNLTKENLLEVDANGIPKYITILSKINSGRGSEMRNLFTENITNYALDKINNKEVNFYDMAKITEEDYLLAGTLKDSNNIGLYFKNKKDGKPSISLRSVNPEEPILLQNLLKRYVTFIHETVHLFTLEYGTEGLVKFFEENGLSYKEVLKDTDGNRYFEERFISGKKELAETIKNAIETKNEELLRKFTPEEVAGVYLDKPQFSKRLLDIIGEHSAMETFTEMAARAIAVINPREYVGKLFENINIDSRAAQAILNKVAAGKKLNDVISGFHNWAMNTGYYRRRAEELLATAVREELKPPEKYTKEKPLANVNSVHNIFDEKKNINLKLIPKEYHNRSVVDATIGFNKVLFAGKKYYNHPIGVLIDNIYKAFPGLKPKEIRTVLNDIVIKPALNILGKDRLKEVVLSEWNDFNKKLIAELQKNTIYNPDAPFYTIKDYKDPKKVFNDLNKIQRMTDLFGTIKDPKTGIPLRDLHNQALRELGIPELTSLSAKDIVPQIMHNLKKLNPLLSAIWAAVDKGKINDIDWINRALQHYQEKAGTYLTESKENVAAQAADYPNYILPLAHLYDQQPAKYYNLLKRCRILDPAGKPKEPSQLLVEDIHKIAQRGNNFYSSKNFIDIGKRLTSPAVEYQGLGEVIAADFYELFNFEFTPLLDKIGKTIAPWIGGRSIMHPIGALSGHKYRNEFLELALIEQTGRQLIYKAGLEINKANILDILHNLPESWSKRYNELKTKLEKTNFKIAIEKHNHPYKNGTEIKGKYNLDEAINIFLDRTINPIYEYLADYFGIDKKIKHYLPLQLKNGQLIDFDVVLDGKTGRIFYSRKERTGEILSYEWEDINSDIFNTASSYIQRAFYEKHYKALEAFTRDLLPLVTDFDTKSLGGVLPKGAGEALIDSFKLFTGEKTRREHAMAERFYNIRYRSKMTNIAVALIQPSHWIYGLYKARTELAKLFHIKDYVGQEVIKRVKESGETISPQGLNYMLGQWRQLIAGFKLFGSVSLWLQQGFQILNSMALYGIRPTARALFSMAQKKNWNKLLEIEKDPILKQLSGLEPQTWHDITVGGKPSEFGRTLLQKISQATFWHWQGLFDSAPRYLSAMFALDYFKKGSTLLPTRNNLYNKFIKNEVSAKEFSRWIGTDAFLYTAFKNMVDKHLLEAERINQAIYKPKKLDEPIKIDGREYSYLRAREKFEEHINRAQMAYAYGFAQFSNYFYDLINGPRRFGMEKVALQFKNFFWGQLQTLWHTTVRMGGEIARNPKEWEARLGIAQQLYKQKQMGDWRAFGATLRRIPQTWVLAQAVNSISGLALHALLGEDHKDHALDLSNLLPFTIPNLKTFARDPYKAAYQLSKNFVGPGFSIIEDQWGVLLGIGGTLADMAGGKKIQESQWYYLLKNMIGNQQRNFEPAIYAKNIRFLYEMLTNQRMENAGILANVLTILPKKWEEGIKKTGLKITRTDKPTSKIDAFLRYIGAWNYDNRASNEEIKKNIWWLLKTDKQKTRWQAGKKPERKTWQAKEEKKWQAK